MSQGAVSRNGLCSSVPSGARASSHSRGAVTIKLVLFLLGGHADPLLERRVGDGDEPPRLEVGAAGGRTGRAEAVLDHPALDRAIAELSHRAPMADLGQKLRGTTTHFFWRVGAVARQRLECGLDHARLPTRLIGVWR